MHKTRIWQKLCNRRAALFGGHGTRPSPESGDQSAGLSGGKLSFAELARLTAKIPGVVYQYYRNADGSAGFNYISPRIADDFDLDPAARDHVAAFASRVHPDERQGFLESMEQAIATRQNWFYEGRYLRSDGRTIWFRVQSEAEERAGTVIFHGLLQDITEIRQTAEALQQSEELLRTTFDVTADGILVVDRAGRVTQMNERFRQLWRIPPDFNFDDDARLLELILDQLEDPQAFKDRVYELYGSNEQDLAEIRFKDGRIFERYSTPIAVAGQHCGRLWDFRDISARKSAEAELHASRESYRQLLDNTPLPLVISRRSDEHVEFINREGLKHFGLSAEDVANGLCGLDFYTDLSDREKTSWALKDQFKGYALTRMIKMKSPKYPDLTSWGYLAAILTTLEGEDVYIAIFNDISELKRTQDALRLSENRYRALVESAGVGILLFDMDFKTVYANPHYLKLLDASPAEQLNQPAQLWLHPDDQARLDGSRETILTQDQQELDLRFRHRDGHYLDFNVKITLLNDPDGQPHNIMAILHDQTAQKLSEAALRQSRESYRSLIENMPFPIVISDDDAHIRYINQEGLQFFRLAPEDVAAGIDGRDFYENPDDRDQWIAQLKDHGFAKNMLITVRSPKHPDLKHWGFFSVIPTVFDGQSTFMMTMNDLSDLRDAQQALRENEEMFRTLTESSPVPIHIRQNGRVVYANPANETLLGYSNAEFLAMRDPFGMVHPDFFETVHQRSRDRLAGQTTSNRYDIQLITKQGESRWVHLASEVITYRGAPATLTTFVDITESVLAAEALRRGRETYRNLIEIAPFPIVLTSSEARIIYINQEGHRFFGFEPDDEVVGLNGYDFYDSPADRERWFKRMQQDGIVHDMEMWVRSPKNHALRHWGLFSAIPTEFDGAPAFLLTMKDLTDLRAARLALEASEEMFRTLTESSPVPIHIRQNGRIVYANPANIDLAGYSLEELYAMPDPLALVHPDFRPVTRQRVHDRTTGRDVPRRYDIQLITKDGQPRWVHQASETINYRGAPAILTTFVDITESVMATQALRASRESYRNLIEVAPFPIVITRRANGIVKYINAEAYKLFELTQQDVAAGISGFDFYERAEDRQNWIDQVERVGLVRSIEMNIRSPRHPELKFWGSFAAIPTVFEGEEVYLITFNDLSALKRSQAALSESEAMFRSLTEDSPVALHIRQNERVVYANPATEQLLGYSRQELYAMDEPYELIHPDHRELARLRSQERQQGLNPPNRYEIKMLTRAGAEIWVRAESELVNYGGRPSLLTTFVDITAMVEKERALVESEEKFRTFTESSPTPICIRKGSRILYANHAAEELLGFSLAELYAMPNVFQLVPEEDRDEISERSRQREAGGNPTRRYQHRLIAKSGEMRWVHVANERISYQGETALLTSYLDITEIVKKEEALLASEAKFRTFTEATPVSICIRKGARVLYANPATTELLGFSADELYAMENVFELLPPEDIEMISQRSLAREAGATPPKRYEHRLMTKTGEYRWVMTSNETISYQDEPAILTTYLDITERVRNEEALRESEEMFRTFTEATPVSVHIRQNDRVVYANPATVKLLGYELDELYAMDNIFTLVHPDFRELIIRRGHERAAGQNPPTSYEFRLVTKDGRSVWVHTATERIMYKGQPASLSTFIDISAIIEKEQALSDSEERFRTIVEQSPYSMMIFSPDGRLIQVNPAHNRLWGLEPGKLPEYNILEDEQLRTLGFTKLIERAFQGETVNIPPAEYDLSSTLGEGHEVWVEGQLYSVKNSDGGLRQVILIHHDITARIQAQQKLLDKTAELDRFFSLALDMLCIAGLDGELKRINPAWEQALGFSVAELTGRNFMELVHPDDIASTQQVLQELSTGHDSMNFVNRYRCKDGSYRYIEWRSAPYEGRLAYAAARDITERRQAEAELRRLRNLLSNILDSMPSIMVGVDAAGQITHFNREASRLTGLSAEQAEGRSLRDVLPEFSSEMGRIEEVIRRRTTYRQEKVPRNAEGEVLYNDITLFPLIANGVSGAVIRIDDVTERVRIEEMIVQSEKMLSVGGLAAGMAHEINNPLAGILQNIQVIRSRLSPELDKNQRTAADCGLNFEALSCYLERREIWNMVDAILESGSRAAKIVSNMLSFSRKAGSAMTPQDLRELMDQTLELAASDYDLKKRYDFKRIAIVRDYAPELPEVACEAGQIQQVFLNILKNGAQAMSGLREREPRFIIRLKPEAQSVRIEIEDNGPGMDDRTLKRIFEPFYTTKAVGAGTGLGLSVSYFIITENHGGNLSAQSNPEQGTRFIIQLPLTRATQ